MPRRTAHHCTDFEKTWKITNGGILRCVCGEAQELMVEVDGNEHSDIGVSFTFTRDNAPGIVANIDAILTDDHSAGKADTSREAFASTDRVKRMVEVTELLRASFNGLTADEAAAAMGVGQATTSARFNELKRAGMVTKVERRLTRTGRSAWAYRIKAGM